MKILNTNKFFYKKGGSELVFFDTADILQEKGHDVAFFSMQDKKNIKSCYDKYFINNVDYTKSGLLNKLNISLKLLYSIEAKNKLNKLLSKEKVDIAHLHNIHHQISPSIIHTLKKKNIPMIMTLHDYKMVCACYTMMVNNSICERCKEGRYYNCFKNRCMKGSFLKSLLGMAEMYLHHDILKVYEKNVDIFISPSMFLKNKLEKMGFRGKIIHLFNFVNLKDYIPQYDFYKDKYILYLGRLSYEKGIMTLINAVRDVSSVKLKILGEGSLKKEINKKIEKEKINNIALEGYKQGEELKNSIKNAMAVCVPSEWYENNPMSIIEAFALGKPVIGANIGGIPELVKDCETGLLFESGNADDLKLKIEQMISSKDKIIEMGKNARAFVEKECSHEVHYKKLMNIYESVMN